MKFVVKIQKSIDSTTKGFSEKGDKSHVLRGVIREYAGCILDLMILGGLINVQKNKSSKISFRFDTRDLRYGLQYIYIL